MSLYWTMCLDMYTNLVLCPTNLPHHYTEYFLKPPGWTNRANRSRLQSFGGALLVQDGIRRNLMTSSKGRMANALIFATKAWNFLTSGQSSEIIEVVHSFA